MRLTSTAAIGFWTRPTMVTSLIVTTRGFFCAEASDEASNTAAASQRGKRRKLKREIDMV
jgi:hypothetical protein